jgi:hypothetical protein
MRSTLAFGPQITMHTLASFPTPLVPSRMALSPYPLISYGPKGACIGCLNRSSHMPRQPRRYSCRYGYSIRVRGAMHHEDLILYALCSITSPTPLTDSIHSNQHTPWLPAYCALSRCLSMCVALSMSWSDGLRPDICAFQGY